MHFKAFPALYAPLLSSPSERVAVVVVLDVVVDDVVVTDNVVVVRRVEVVVGVVDGPKSAYPDSHSRPPAAIISVRIISLFIPS
jgi:hypothetical protein